MKLALTVGTLLLSTTVVMAQGAGPGAHFIEQWDSDADGQLTLQEAATKREEVFYMFDSDTDQTLNATEWAAVAEHLAQELGQKGGAGGHGMGPGQAIHEAMTPAFNDADKNGTVTADEFKAATQTLFGLIDTNADGVMTTADFGRP
jgi:hypothetical protein